MDAEQIIKRAMWDLIEQLDTAGVHTQNLALADQLVSVVHAQLPEDLLL